MIRRSRISVRPNVRPGGRGLSSSSQEPKPAAEPPPGSPKAQKRDAAGREPQDEALKAGSESAPPPPPLTKDTRAEQQASLNQEEKNHNGKASGNSVPPATPIQRRKRISAMPNLAKPRTAPPQARTPRPAASGTAKNKEPTPKDSAVLENTAPQTLPKSPGRRRASAGPPQLKVPDKKSGNLKEVKTAPASQDPAADSNQSRNDETQQTHDCPSKLKTSQDSFCVDDHWPSSPGKLKASQNDICVDDHHPHPEHSQGKLKDSQNSTCIEEKQRRPESSLPLRKSTASSDRERIIKARKLRELLKKEIRKEKKQKKGKTPDFEFITPVDRSKMTMRDFIYYLPENNPMKSSLEEERREIDKVIGPMPSKDPANKAPLRPPVRDEDEDDHEEEDVEHVQDDQVLVPRVKVAEDGSIIIDEESLTVEVLRTQGPNVVEENDPVFERGSTTTYSSFRKSTHTKPWTNRETDMFFLAISMVGTDFSIIGQLFPHRARVEIKNKFKREERENSWRIDKAFKEKRPFDFEFFSQLLERILKDDERKRLNRNKVTLGKKPANPKRKKKEKKADQDKALDGGGSVEVSDSEVAEGDADAETAEKENEDSLNVNEGEASAAGDPDAKKKRKRKKNDAESSGPATKKPSEDSSERQQKAAKKRKRIKSVEICEDSEEVDYENMPPLEGSPYSSPCRREDSDTPEVPAQIKKQQIAEEEDVSGPAEETAGPEAAETPKLAQSSRLQKPKPCLRLATKTGAKAAVDKPNELSQASHFISHGQAAEPHCVESATEGTAASHLKRSTAGDKRPSSDIHEEEEEHDITAIQQKMLQKPTRSGRIPKFSSHLKQPEDDEPPAASPSASPPWEAVSPQRRGRGRPPQFQKAKPSALKGRDQKKDQRPGKTALVTLRASVKETEENSDEEGEPVMEEEDSFPMNPEELNQAPAFVPVSLRSPAPVPAQVEETMEELEVSVSVPDTRCAIEAEHLHHSDSVCSQSLDQSPAETAVTENCLHLLVDVIEVSTSEKDEDNSLPVNDSSTDSDRSCLAVKKDLVCQPSSAASPGENDSGVSEEPPCQALEPGLVEMEKAAAVSQDSMQAAHSQAGTCEATTRVLHETPSEMPGEETAVRAQALRDPCTLEEAANTTGVVNAPEVSCGSKTPSPNQERGRRSRFPKPKPNLGGKTAQRRSLETKPPQSDSGQDSCDASRKAEVHFVQQKPAEEKQSEVNSCKDEGVSEELREVKALSLSFSEEGLRKDGTDIVVNAPEASCGSETPSPNQERGRRSRFPKPKPNLGAKTAQRRNLETKPLPTDSGQDSCEDASRKAEVHFVQQKPAEEKQSEVNSCKDEGVSEELREVKALSLSFSEEGLRKDGTDIVVNAPEASCGTETPSPNQERGRRSRFPKPKPNLGAKTAQHRNLETKPLPTDSGQDSCEGVQQKPAEEKQSEVNSCKDEGVSEELREVKALSLSFSEEGLRKDGTDIVVNAPEASCGTETPSPNQERGRRSRFPKPKPNRGAKTAQHRNLETKPLPTDSGQDSCEGVQQKPAEEKQSEVNSCKDEGVSEELREVKALSLSFSEEGLRKDGTDIVVNAPEASCGTETPSPNQERGRRSRFPKPKPNRGAKTAQHRNLETKPLPTDSGQDSCEGVQQKPAEEKQSEVNSCKDEGVSEELREVKALSLSFSEEGLRKDGTDIVVNAPEASCGTETPSPNQERGRRSRFPKPKPNLGAKTAQHRNLETKPLPTDSGQDSCEGVQQKPAEEKQSEVNSCKDEGVSEELREVKALSLSFSEEGLRKDGTDIVVNAPEVSYCSETPSPNQERGRRSRFPKPKPNLGTKTAQRRNLETKPAQSDSGQDSCGDASNSPAVDIAPHHPVDEKKCDSSRDEGIAEKLGDRDSSSCAEGLKQDNTNIRPALESLPKPTDEDERVEKKPAKPPLRRPKPNLSGKLRIRIPPEKDASTAASTGKEQNAIPEDGTVSTLDSPVSKKAEVRSPKADEKPSTSVISQNTEGSLAANEFPQQEPTFILTLFEIPPSLLGDYDDSTSSLSTVSAELLSSPVFVDHVPAELPETQSLVSEAVEVESYSMSGCTEDAGIVSLDQFSQPVYRSGEEGESKELPATLAHVKDLTTDLGEEEYVSITLEPVEDFPAAAEADSAETSNGAAQQSRQKNKPPGRPRRGKLQVKPNTSKKQPPVSTGARGALKVMHIEPQERPLSAETASCTPLPQPSEEHSTQEECSQREGEEASNSSVKATEPSTENIGAGEHLTLSTANTLPPSVNPLIRPGRKPKGFLSFISQKSSSDNSPKPHRTTSQKPQISTTGLDRKRTATGPAVDLSSESSAGSPPSAGMRLCASRSSTPVAERVGTASSQLIHFPMMESCSSESNIEEVFCTKNSAVDKEPTSISQYFFSDIFTEVDDTD
ncbi:transcription factor TFIIIB component B'' homolog isoform X3 [Polyodon spathula]|uniref:transcription factor TFIIIB component B'' homolog isoform X3 n=1 Tax=Polyodon spathula TaxID=7913 RepID=UPI001B7EED78|nr:transcription factor TFIIIB component B'' homolog isoform X3 [Polyodon spathula]